MQWSLLFPITRGLDAMASFSKWVEPRESHHVLETRSLLHKNKISSITLDPRVHHFILSLARDLRRPLTRQLGLDSLATK